MGFFETTEPRILLTSKGTLIAATQARRIGKSDAPEGQGIVVSRSTDHGHSWGSEMLLDQNAHDVWGYSALVEVDGVISCYVVAGHPSHQQSNPTLRGIYVYHSSDDGRTWSTRKLHKGLSEQIGLSPGQKIPSGASPNCNILVVPGLTLDGKSAPPGHGLLLSTYAHGHLFASIDGGTNWQSVAHVAAYADAKTNGYGTPISIENELAWCVLDNQAGDIYMAWRRQAFTGYKNEYVVSKHFTSGPLGMKVKEVYNQDLKNIEARRCHFGMRTIDTGKHQGKLLVATQGAGSRHHIRLLRSTRAIRGEDSISANLFEKGTVLKDVAWGYCDLVYLSQDAEHARGMGKDAILLFGESEPIHKETHQIIKLDPSGKGRDERYTCTLFALSMDYFDFLLDQANAFLTPTELFFEANQGWTGYPLREPLHPLPSAITDHNGITWKGENNSLGIYHRNGLARSGKQCLVLGHQSSEIQSFTVQSPHEVSQLSFFIKRFSSRTHAITLTVEARSRSGSWATAYTRTFSGDQIPSSFEPVVAPIEQSGPVTIRISVTGTKGFLFDDFVLSP